MAKKLVADYKPAEGVTLIVGEVTAIYAAVQGHDYAAVAIGVGALIPAVTTFFVNLIDAARVKKTR